MKRALMAATLLAGLALPAAAQTQFPARLAGFAAIPALSLLTPPADAPASLWVSGKFAGPGNLRTTQPMSIPGDTGPMHGSRRTGISLPFIGQPLQGFSGFSAARAADGSVISLTDNGFGNKRNSPDAMLFFHRIAPDWANNRITVRETIFLRDPDRVVPFRIALEDTPARYLTGADFDLESIQLVGDAVWIGDEFGPFLIRATLDGRVTGVFETRVGETLWRSPDHPAFSIPANPTQGVAFQVPRSGGFEGMAASPDGRFLYPMLEQPTLSAQGAPETHNGRRFLRVFQFDVAAARYTGREFRYPLEDAATAIGDFNMIDDRRALVIERDNGEGDPSLACANPREPRPDCFPMPARFKRIVLVDLMADDGGFVRKLGHVDLMDISDPENLARVKGAANRDLAGKYTFPFFTIENVMRVDEHHIMVAVDNNLPFSSGRFLDRAADNEFVLLDVRELLAAR
jgi:hypothetical protein